MLVKLQDGGIKEIHADTWSSGGCITCDWGSQYVNEYDIKMTTGRIKIRVEQMYSYELTEGFMMELLLTNIDEIRGYTEREFYVWVRDAIKKEAEYAEDIEVEFYPK